MENNQNINRDYKGKKNSDIINFPLQFRRDFLSPINDKKVLEMPLYGYKIIWKILNDISMDQFNPNNINQSKQLSLFENELMTSDNSYVRMTFKLTDICKNRNYTEIEKALRFLEEYKKDWYKSKNAKGKIIKTLGGLISNAVISEGKIGFLIPNYWFSKLIKIDKYNVALFDVAFNLSSGKQILIYLWILELKDTGTIVSFEGFQKTFGYNYANANVFVKNVFKPLKNRLDDYSNKSFNYNVKGSNLIIRPYLTKDIILNLKTKTNIKREITRKIAYWKERHQLSNDNIEVFKTIIKLNQGDFKLLLDAYTYFINKCKKDKVKSTSFINESFMIAFQDAIKNEYKNTSWGGINKNGFPKLTS